MTPSDSAVRQPETEQMTAQAPSDDTVVEVNATARSSNGQDPIMIFVLASQPGAVPVDVTDRMVPLILKTPLTVSIVINEETAEIGEIMLDDGELQFWLVASSVGVYGQYTDSGGDVYPDARYAAVKPRLR